MRRLLLFISVLCALLVVPPVAGAGVEAADAAKAKSAKQQPKVRLVAPMRVTVGRNVVIRGGIFSRSVRRNTVIFRAPNRRVAFAKPSRAFPRKLVVRVPASVERLLRKEDGDASKGLPTRLQLRVITRKRFGRLTIVRRSPLVVSGLRTGAPAACGTGDDFDNDLLSNALEARLKTDPCRADTDGDGVEDGFEYHSALDLNQRAVPFPGKRPFPNALDPSDAGNDYDGDGLSNLDEFRAWAHPQTSPAPSLLQFYTGDLRAPAFGGPYGNGPAFGNHALPFNYSDGTQATVSVTPGHPEWAPHLDLDRDGRLTDDERDADGDGLSNHDELRKLMVPAFYPNQDGCAYQYEPSLPRNFAQTDYLETDSDGDGVWDGNDDQDNDDVSNVDEIVGPFMTAAHPEYDACDGENVAPLPVDGNGSRDGGEDGVRHPYNPCQPYPSRTCNRYVPR